LILAPDMPGNGDSPPLDVEQPSIADYSQAMVEFLDALGIEKADAYGSHTGSAIAIDLAISAPSRVRRIVLDGVADFPADERKVLLERYAHPFTPDLAGTHLIRAFLFCRDQFLFFPWYASDAEHRRDTGLSAPEPLHAWVVEVLKAATTYHLAYRAAFAYPAEKRLAEVTCPALLVAADNDPLREMTAAIASRVTKDAFITLPRSDAEHYADYRKVLAGELLRFLKN
jgi:pimeloyl-ACP methyl ester carboxylesterase